MMPLSLFCPVWNLFHEIGDVPYHPTLWLIHTPSLMINSPNGFTASLMAIPTFTSFGSEGNWFFSFFSHVKMPDSVQHEHHLDTMSNIKSFLFYIIIDPALYLASKFCDNDNFCRDYYQELLWKQWRVKCEN